jgi:hypothetical protein
MKSKTLKVKLIKKKIANVKHQALRASPKVHLGLLKN